jgi:hypothetical protein
MRTLPILVALLLNAACSSASEKQQAALMNEAETLVKLPEGAGPLQEYSRYYTYGRDGEVIGIYAGRYLAKNAERKWVSDARRLPVIMDGGCGVVNIRFDVKSKKAVAWCNGDA